MCLNNQPPCASIALRNTSSWAASATRIASASASHRRVEPSTSVNRNVTTPEGAAAGGADIPAESHSRHAVTPCPVHSRIASRASCAKHPKWHNWHSGAEMSISTVRGAWPSELEEPTRLSSIAHAGSLPGGTPNRARPPDSPAYPRFSPSNDKSDPCNCNSLIHSFSGR